MLRPRPWRRPMVARDHSEGHRQASWLELLFDLSFVVAVAQAAREFEHALAAGHPGSGLVSYLLVFAAIWWAWMAFTWFANVFDTDDVPYRLLMLVMIAGSLGLAAGVPQLAQLDFRIGVISYVVMRLAYVLQWVRVFRNGDPVWRPVALKIIVLTTINQAGWVLFLWVPLEWRVRGVRRVVRGRRRDADTRGLGRAHGRASRPHRRALWTVHADRARRVDRGRDGRRRRRDQHGGRSGAAAHARGGRAHRRVQPVVDLLRLQHG